MVAEITCAFVSVWDGGIEIESTCTYNRDTGLVTNITDANLPDGILESLDQLEEQYIMDGDEKLLVEDTDRGEYAVVRTS